MIPWSPLARGFLAGNRRSATDAETRARPHRTFGHGLYYAPEDFTVAERCAEVARERGVKPAQIALAWVLSRPGVTAPIVGASKMHQLDEAVAASVHRADATTKCGGWRKLYVPHRVLGM